MIDLTILSVFLTIFLIPFQFYQFPNRVYQFPQNFWIHYSDTIQFYACITTETIQLKAAFL